MKTKQFRTSALFTCDTCGVDFETLSTAREEAYNHAKVNRGHHVRGEICTAYHYDFAPKEIKKN